MQAMQVDRKTEHVCLCVCVLGKRGWQKKTDVKAWTKIPFFKCPTPLLTASSVFKEGRSTQHKYKCSARPQGGRVGV